MWEFLRISLKYKTWMIGQRRRMPNRRASISRHILTKLAWIIICSLTLSNYDHDDDCKIKCFAEFLHFVCDCLPISLFLSPFGHFHFNPGLIS